VHDELVLEVDPCMVAQAGRLLQICMEEAASLLGISFNLNFDSYLMFSLWEHLEKVFKIYLLN
jgi:DNA polymerase I-like protein with 3'-5' exonuclease and polymerase domains